MDCCFAQGEISHRGYAGLGIHRIRIAGIIRSMKHTGTEFTQSACNNIVCCTFCYTVQENGNVFGD